MVNHWLTFLLTPAYSSDLFLAPMAVGGLCLMLWLIVKGVDVTQWEARGGF